MKNVIYNGENSIIYLENKGDKKVARKILRSEYPKPNQILNFNNELNFTVDLDHPGVRKAIDGKKEEGKHVLYLEYIEGVTLYDAFVQERRSLKEILAAFIKICDALAYVHNAGIIHKDINDHNILWVEENLQPVLIDFGISSRLDLKSHNLGNPDTLQGTLPFMPPEQTGRVNRKVDNRSDLYSLGITLFRALTGELPFDSSDSLEMVHFQIAKLPAAAMQVNKGVPKPISDIVAKLLQKNGEDRYQTASGLKADLEVCLDQLETKGEISEFEIGGSDYSATFEIPQKLYGRDNEIAQLLETFDNVSKGNTELFLVAGYSGVGKSSLISELYKPITERRAFFVDGKFDQYQHNVPYYAISQAFSEFCKLLLIEKPERLEAWKTQLTEALGDNGQILIDFVPDLEKIIGPQPAVVKLEPQEAQNRFILVFQEFIKAICKAEHPFVLFIDDLQWADIGSLNFIRRMITDISTPYFMIIGAYRDNEIGPGHSLPKIIDDAKESGASIREIKLEPLQKSDVFALVNDALHSDEKNSKKISDQVYAKTEGNAFFTVEYLKSLNEQGAFHFSVESRSWQIDFEALKKLDISDNVVELLMGKIKGLDDINQHVVQLAACIGGLFSLNLLSIIHGKGINETKEDLWPAIEGGLITPVGENYQYIGIDGDISKAVNFEFLHDRVQQAAYSIIDVEEKSKVHLDIGRLLKKELDKDADILFDVVNQLNASRKLITDRIEIAELINLNLEASLEARKGSAFQSAKEYIQIATELVDGDLWSKDYELAKRIYTTQADLEFLNRNLAESQSQLEDIIKRLKTTLEKAEIYAMLMRNNTLSNKYAEAISYGHEALELLEFEFPQKNHEAHIPEMMQKVVGHIMSSGIAEVHKMDKIEDAKVLAILRILDNFSEPTYVSGDSNFWILHVLYMVDITFENGLSAEGSYSFVELGLIFFILNNYDFAYPCAEESVKMASHFEETSPQHMSRVGHLFTNYNTPWVKHISETFSLNAKYFKLSVDTGEMIFAGYTSWFPFANNHFWGNRSAHDLLENLDAEIAFNQKIGHFLAYHSLLGLQIILKNASGQTKSRGDFNTKGLKENDFVKACVEVSDIYALTVYRVYKAYASLMYGEVKKALTICNEVLEFAPVIMGMVAADGLFKFVHSIAILQHQKGLKKPDKKQIEIVEGYLNQYKIWSDNNPSSFEHKYLLISAELASLNGEDEKAMQLYNDAIASASEAEFERETAFAHLLTANYWKNRGLNVYADPHLSDAR
jgi:predicted ATPase/tRNA A-37 threonylcarbamoyl transferase component Bud32